MADNRLNPIVLTGEWQNLWRCWLGATLRGPQNQFSGDVEDVLRQFDVMVSKGCFASEVAAGIIESLNLNIGTLPQPPMSLGDFIAARQ